MWKERNKRKEKKKKKLPVSKDEIATIKARQLIRPRGKYKYTVSKNLKFSKKDIEKKGETVHK